MNYKNKYLKYKLKYLNLKKIYGGSNDNNNNDDDENDIKDLIDILQQVEDSIKEDEDPIKANILERENQANDNKGRFYEGDFAEQLEIDDFKIEDAVQGNRDAIDNNRDNIVVNKENIGKLFHICKVQQIQLIKISKMLHNLFSIQKTKLFKEWQENYRTSLYEAINRTKTGNSGTQ